MTRVRYVNKEQASPDVREQLERMEASGAKILNIYKTVANSRAGVRNFFGLGASLLTRAQLDPRLRELAILRVARLTGSEYEWSQHYPMALERGVTPEQAKGITKWQTVPEFDDRDRAVLQYIDEVAQKVKVEDETFERLRQHLDEISIVELTLSIGYWGMVARVLVALQVDLDEQPATSVQELLGGGQG